MNVAFSSNRYCRISFLLLLAFTAGAVYGEDDLIRISSPWEPQRAFPIGDGALFTQTFVYPSMGMGIDPPYFMRKTPIAYCANDATLIPVLDDIPRGVSITAVDGNMAHVVGGISIEQESAYQGRIYPTRLHMSSDGLNWTTLDDAPEIMWKMPYHLFKAHGCLFLECTALDVKDFIASFGITLEPGMLVDLSLIEFLLSGNLAPAVYFSCDDGVTWTEMLDIPWHDLEQSSIPQYDLPFNGYHFVRSVTDINNPFRARAYLLRSDTANVWQYQNIVIDAFSQHVSSIALFQNALYALATTIETMHSYPPDYAAEDPTVWKTMNGVDWTAHSLHLPIESAMVAADHILIASPLDIGEYGLHSPGLYYSHDGASWFFWRDWPDDYDDSNSRAIPLVLTEDALYATVDLLIDEPPWHTTELWRMPLTLFTDGPPRGTISRALHQPAEAAAFPVVFDIAWSKPVYGFTSDDILLDGFYFILAESSAKEAGTHYTLTVTSLAPGANETIIAPTIPPGAAVDDLSNPNEAAACMNATVLLNLPPEMPVYRYYVGLALIVLLAAAGGTRLRLWRSTLAK